MASLDKRNPASMQVDLSLFELATQEEKNQIKTMKESSSFLKDGLDNIRKNVIVMVSIIIFILITLLSIVLPPIYPYDYETTSANSTSLSTKYQKPFEYSPKEKAAREGGEKVFPHVFGTDDLGRDYAARVIYGTRISLFVGIVAALIVVVIGILYGAVSGYVGGRTDMIMMRIVDIIYSLPDMLIIILLSVGIKDILLNGRLSGTWIASMGPGLVSIFIVFGMLYWVGMARLVRGQVLLLKEQEFVLAAEASGAKVPWIIRKHMISNSLSIIFISAALQIPSAIFTESYLSFLGLGVSIPMPSLGSLAATARGQLMVRPYMIVIPSAVIFLIILSLNLIGNGLRDAFDPRLRGGSNV